MIRVAPADPRAPQVRAVLAQSHALMLDLFPPEACHFLDIEALCIPEITLFAATEGDEILGTGALKTCDGYGELKSMFTTEAARGRGVAQSIYDAIEAKALAATLPRLMLETGDILHAAHQFYTRNGFVLCGPFGDYQAEPRSIFMEKPLRRQTNFRTKIRH